MLSCLKVCKAHKACEAHKPEPRSSGDVHKVLISCVVLLMFVAWGALFTILPCTDHIGIGPKAELPPELLFQCFLMGGCGVSLVIYK